MLGILLAITAAFCWGTSAIFARLGLQRIKPSIGVLISMVSSLVLVGLLSLLIDFDAMVSISPAALLWFGLIGFINYALGRQFNYLGIKYIGVTKATPIFASAPLFAMVIAVIFTGETVNLPIIVGTLSLVGGLVLLVTSK